MTMGIIERFVTVIIDAVVTWLENEVKSPTFQADFVAFLASVISWVTAITSAPANGTSPAQAEQKQSNPATGNSAADVQPTGQAQAASYPLDRSARKVVRY